MKPLDYFWCLRGGYLVSMYVHIRQVIINTHLVLQFSIRLELVSRLFTRQTHSSPLKLVDRTPTLQTVLVTSYLLETTGVHPSSRGSSLSLLGSVLPIHARWTTLTRSHGLPSDVSISHRARGQRLDWNQVGLWTYWFFCNKTFFSVLSTIRDSFQSLKPPFSSPSLRDSQL